MKSHKRKNYSLAFKIQAVEKYLENGRNLKETAEGLGVHPATMGHWVQKGIEALKAELTTSTPSSLEAEIKRLRSENSHLKEENDFLRKAARMFAAHL